MPYVNYHPVFLALSGKKVLIVGGGFVAMEKLESLLPTGAEITVISPDATSEILEWQEEGRLHYIGRKFQDGDEATFFMLVAATNDSAVNAHIFQLGEGSNKLANSVDDPDNCNFIMSANTKQGPMQAAISSAGCSPALAQRLRRDIAQRLLTEDLGHLADYLGSWRAQVKQSLHGYKLKQAFWESVIDSEIPKLLRIKGTQAADVAMQAHLDRFARGDTKREGRVILVGAGPGDPELLTLKALKALGSADVVLYDRLTNPKFLEFTKPTVMLIDVGKARGECGKPRQELIHAMMLEHALSGKIVVRLKGGDPFVFGRGGEEVLALREAGIPYEIVPGVSSAIAAASSVEIPVTHRGISTGFAVFTAQGAASDIDTVPWESVRQMPTLVLLMGVEKLPEIVHRLRASGHEEDLPVAVISHATLETQQRAVGTVGTIVNLAKDLPSPATIVIGEVVRLAKNADLNGLSLDGSSMHNVLIGLQ